MGISGSRFCGACFIRLEMSLGLANGLTFMPGKSGVDLNTFISHHRVKGGTSAYRLPSRTRCPIWRRLKITLLYGRRKTTVYPLHDFFLQLWCYPPVLVTVSLNAFVK